MFTISRRLSLSIKLSQTLIYSLVSLLAVVLIAGCGYSARSLLPAHLKTVYVKTFVNKINIASEISERREYKSYKPGLEIDATDAVTDRIIYDGNLRIVGEKEADSILTGELVDYTRQPLRYGDDDVTVAEYRVYVTVRVDFEDLQKDKFLLENATVTGDSTRTTSGRFARTEAEALDEALEDLGRRVVEKIVQLGW